MHTQFAQQLAAFVPTTVLTHPMPVGKVMVSDGATLFTDLSGFTHLTETLAQAGDWGAEQLSQTLRTLFTPLIDAIHTHGGTISHFYGDGMLVFFLGDGKTTVPQAFRCAAALQAAIQSFQTISIDKNHFQLSLKCGVGYGTLHSLVVAAGGQREFVLAGSSVEEATAAEKVGDHPIEVGARAREYLRLRVVATQSNPLPEKLPTWVREFVPPAIVERLAAAGKVAPTLAEHRPISSIFVRFAGLSTQDGEFGRKLNSYFRWIVTLVNRYAKENGRVNRILTGDKGNQLHIIFGAPTAPHAPAQALRLAIAMQRERPEFISSQQIGIACGRAFAVPLGSERRHEYTIIGEVVNLSARMCDVCPPNEIICDPYTAAITDQTLQFEQREPIALKGIQAPIAPMRLVGIKANPAQLEARYGDSFGKRLNIHREAFATLRAALERGTRYIALVGEAGIGKSRIVAEAATQWLAQGGAGFVGACAVESAENPYTPWFAIVRGLIDLPATASPDIQMAQMQALYNRLHDNEHVRVLIADLPLLFEAMGLPVELPAPLVDLDAKTRQARLFALIRDSLRFFTRVQPHLFVFEDIHHADRASLDLIDFLANEPDLQLTFLVTTRQPPTAEITTVTLARLAPAETIAYVAELLALESQPLPDPLVTYFTRAGSHATSATPLFLEEAVRAMWAHNALRHVDGMLAVDEHRLAQLTLPNNVHALLLARIDQLPHIQRTLLNVAAVIGAEFEATILRSVVPFAENRIEHALTKLQSAEFIRSIGNNTYLFQHGMTREAAYDTLPFEERRQLHAEVAQALEAQYVGRERQISAELARHHAYADHHEKAVQYGKVAAQDAFELYALRETLRLCDLCLQHVGDQHSVTATALLLLKARSQHQLGDFLGAIESAEQAVHVGEKVAPELIHEGFMMLSEFAFQQGEHQQSLVQTNRLLNHLETRQPDNQEAFAIAYSRMGKALGGLNRHAEALDYLNRAEQLCVMLGDERRRAFVLDSMAFCYYNQHDLTSARDMLRQAVAAARSTVRSNELSALLNNLALICRKLGHYAEANQAIEESLPLAKLASQRLYASALSRKGANLACMGRYEEAEEAFLAATHLLIGMQDNNRLLDVYLLMTDQLYCNIEDIAKAEQSAQNADNIIHAQSAVDSENLVRLFLARGRIALLRMQYTEATMLFEEGLALTSAEKNLRWLPALCFYQGQTAQKMGATALAIRHIERGIAAAQMPAGPKEFLGILLLERALLQDAALRTQQLAAALRQLADGSPYNHCVWAHNTLRAQKIDSSYLNAASALLDDKKWRNQI